MSSYDYDPIYKKRKENVVPNALYQKYDKEGFLFTLSFPMPD